MSGIYHEDIINIDLANSGTVHRSFAAHTLGQGDVLENRFGVRVYFNGEAVDLSSASCIGLFMAPDGSNILISGSSYTSCSGNTAYVQLPQACYNYEGQFTLSIKIIKSPITGTMRIIDGVVSNTGTSGAVAPTGSVPTYQEIVALYDEMVESTNELNALENVMVSGMIGNQRQFHFANLLTMAPKVGYYVRYHDGLEVEEESYQYYTVASPGNYRCFAGQGNAHVAYFDKAGEYISGELVTFQNGYIFTVPATCAYFTYSCSTSGDQYVTICSEHVRAENNSPVATLNEAHVNIGNMPKIVKSKKNLFNKYEVVSGGFIDYSGKGSFDTHASYSYCPWFIPVKPSTTYCPNMVCLVSEFDADYNWIKCNNMSALANVKPFTTTSTTAYVRISCIDVNGFQLEEGSSVTAYSPFQMEFYGNLETENESRTIVVDANGGGNYTTIAGAIGAANDGDTIYICDGTYYESIKANGLRVHLVGESKEHTILKYVGTDYANPPLEMSKGSIENMTIWAIAQQGQSGAGYCLHCDNDSSKDSYLYCRDVVFQNDTYQAVGIGLRPNFTLTFEHCTFLGQFYCHDSQKSYDDMTGQVLRCIDCTFDANNQYFGVIRMQSQEMSGAYATAEFQRCITKNEYSGGPIVTMSLFQDAGLAKDNWLGSTDWHLSGLSALNMSSTLNADS